MLEVYTSPDCYADESLRVEAVKVLAKNQEI